MKTSNTANVCRAGECMGAHLIKRLKKEGYWVRGVDLKENENSNKNSDDFILGDLRYPGVWEKLFDRQTDENLSVSLLTVITSKRRDNRKEL